MKRLAAALGVLSLTVLACPEPLPPGDLQYGSYTVRAERVDGGCVLGSDVEDTGELTFEARLAADEGGEAAWLSVNQPGQGAYGLARQGEVLDGGMRFSTTQRQLIQACACEVEIAETLTFRLQTDVGPADAGTQDAGMVDAGTVDAGIPDAGVEEGPADGGLPSPIPGLPHPDAVLSVGGTVAYEVRDPDGVCPAGQEGCPLPCDFEYEIVEGDRVGGS